MPLAVNLCLRAIFWKRHGRQATLDELRELLSELAWPIRPCPSSVPSDVEVYGHNRTLKHRERLDVSRKSLPHLSRREGAEKVAIAEYGQ